MELLNKGQTFETFPLEEDRALKIHNSWDTVLIASHHHVEDLFRMKLYDTLRY